MGIEFQQINLRAILKGEKVSMNRKQKLSILCGVVLAGVGVLNHFIHFYKPGLDIYLVVVAMITAGFVYHFKGKNNGQGQSNRESGQSITDEIQ